MGNVVYLAGYLSGPRTIAIRERFPAKKAQIVEQMRQTAGVRAVELGAVEEAVMMLRSAEAKHDASAIAEWRDELIDIGMWSEDHDIRLRCLRVVLADRYDRPE